MSKIIAWNFGFLMVGVLLLELFFGSWFQAPQLWSLSIYRNKNWTFPAPPRYPRAMPINYRLDYFGLRGNFGMPGDADILTLGGSTTDERFVSEGETWSDVMGKCLSTVSGKVKVANAGITGQTTRGHSRNFDVWLNHIPKLKPKLTVALFGVNEQGAELDLDWDFVHHWNESDREISHLKIFRKWIYMNSAVYAIFKIIKGNYKAHKVGVGPFSNAMIDVRSFGNLNKKGLTSMERIDRFYSGEKNLTFPNGFNTENRTTVSLESNMFRKKVLAYNQTANGKRKKIQIKKLKDRLEVLRRKVLDFGSTPIFVTQSWATYRRENDLITGDIDFYLQHAYFENQAIMEYCKASEMFCINLGEELSFQNGDFWDSVHTTPQGSKRIGTFICNRILSSGLL